MAVVEALPSQRTGPSGGADDEAVAATSATRSSGSAARKGPRYYEQLMKAADAYSRDHERDALRLLRPFRDALPDSPSVRELLGLAQYRVGHYQAAAKELEAFVELSRSVEQHPVLMDCYRAQRRWRKVDECWRELTAASPGAEVVTEGRIVAAGALADRGRIDEAISLLTRADKKVSKPKPYHLRLWYALGRPRGARRQRAPGPGAVRPGPPRGRRVRRRRRASGRPALTGPCAGPAVG